MSYIQQRGKSYRVRWVQPDGGQRSETFQRKIDAERFKTTLDAGLLQGTYRDPADARRLFGDYAKHWASIQVHRPSTQITTESRLRNHVLPTFGGRQLGSIRKSDVQAWLRALLDKGLEPTTVIACYRTFATIMKSAVEDQLVPSTPCSGIRLPSTDKGPVVPLPRNAVEAIQLGLPEHLASTVTLGAGAGLRIGEVLGLTADRCDFLRRTITIDRQQVLIPGKKPGFGPPKTSSSNRTIPVPTFVLDDLAAHISTHGEGPERLLFHSRTGGPLRRTRFSEIWRTAARTTEWSEADFHDLRHHHASVLISSGCSVKVVQRQLGHASAVETLNTYAHLWPEDDDRVRNAIEAAWSTPIPRPSDAHEA